MRLVVGPYFGEFGWELMSFHGLARKKAKSYDDVIVIAPEGHQVLYEDFSTRFIGHHVDGVKDCWWITCRDNANRARADEAERVAASLGGDRLLPGGLTPIADQAFIKLGKEIPTRAPEILMHVRGPVGKLINHQWYTGHATDVARRLSRAGYSIGMIGRRSKTNPILYDDVEDFRDRPLAEVADVISKAKLVIGPSSGPMHLASLCGTPHLVWTDTRWYSALRGTNRDRYTHKWNPLNTDCVVMDEYGWQPPIVEVVEATLKILGRVA